MVEFEKGTALILAREGGGFDPTEIPRAVDDAGFGPGEISLKATGHLETWDGFPALRLPGEPSRLILGGGARFDELKDADLPADSRLRLEGTMHPSHADKPAGMTVELWSHLDDGGPPG